jgi:hypothetical protein
MACDIYFSRTIEIGDALSTDFIKPEIDPNGFAWVAYPLKRVRGSVVLPQMLVRHGDAGRRTFRNPCPVQA